MVTHKTCSGDQFEPRSGEAGSSERTISGLRGDGKGDRPPLLNGWDSELSEFARDSSLEEDGFELSVPLPTASAAASRSDTAPDANALHPAGVDLADLRLIEVKTSV
jgi:hypothetical protein